MGHGDSRCGCRGLLKTEGTPVMAMSRSKRRAVRKRSPLLYGLVTPGAVSATTGRIAMTSRRRSRSVAPVSGRCKAGVSFAALVRMGVRESPCFAGTSLRIKGLGQSKRFAELAREPSLLSNVSRYCRARQSPIRRKRWGMRAAKRACWRQGAAHVRRSMRKFAI